MSSTKSSMSFWIHHLRGFNVHKLTVIVLIMPQSESLNCFAGHWWTLFLSAQSAIANSVSTLFNMTWESFRWQPITVTTANISRRNTKNKASLAIRGLNLIHFNNNLQLDRSSTYFRHSQNWYENDKVVGKTFVDISSYRVFEMVVSW